ncbi:MAG: prepilin-type N-terminal cleavage/methylation domain-containing protein [Gemmatimonadaceae bacterium]|nr:prepilin-type N-terminal cleavage/methylation domain-containing protein [Gemmatimonadaceae bacterium]
MPVDLHARALTTFHAIHEHSPSPVSGGAGRALHAVVAWRLWGGRARHGVTLLELMVVLALLAVVAAFALPALAPPPPRGATVADAVRAARSAAVARGQLLSLAVDAEGVWEVRALPPDDSLRLTGGALRTPPTAPFRLQLTPLGACVAVSRLPAELAGWDAAGCTAPGIAAQANARRPLREGGR